VANTGTQINLTLKEVEAPCPEPYTGCTCAPTCPTKPNSPSDPDYVPPFVNLTNCPVVYTTTCPAVACTGLTTSILYEFGLLNSVLNNPSLDKVKIKAMISGVQQGFITTVLSTNPTLNYFSGSIVGLVSSTTYDIEIDYLDASNAVVSNCPSLASITTA
jgi:hypothetical protein